MTKGDRHFNRLFVPKKLRAEVLFEMHDKSGHQGRGRTYELTRERFVWPGLNRDFVRCVETCAVCNARKLKTGKPEGLLGQPEIITEPFFVICIDVMELPKSKEGLSKVIVVTDRATRMVVAKAVKDESAETIAKFLLEEIMLKEGCPSEIWSDRGSAFMSEVVSIVCR